MEELVYIISELACGGFSYKSQNPRLGIAHTRIILAQSPNN